MLAGCIPVIIQDGIEMTFSNLVDVESFSIRIAHADIARIPQILRAVTPERIKAMKANLRKVWRRWLWAGELAAWLTPLLQPLQPQQSTPEGEATDFSGASHVGMPWYRDEMQRMVDQHARNASLADASQPAREQKRYDVWADDAWSTLLQWLYLRRQQQLETEA